MTEKRRKLKYKYVDPNGYGWKLALLLVGALLIAVVSYVRVMSAGHSGPIN